MSKEPSYRYFVGNGEKAVALAKEAVDRMQRHQKACQDLRKAYGATHAVQQYNGIAGIAVEVAEQTRPNHIEGFKFKDRHVSEKPGTELHGYAPDKRTATGRKFAAEAGAIGRFDASGWLIAQLGAARYVVGYSSGSKTGAAMYQSSAGTLNGDVLVLKVPVDPEDPFEPPTFLREVKKSEWIAITEEGAACPA